MLSQLKGSGAELSRRVQNLLIVSRVQANAIGAGGSLYLPGSTKIHEQSLADMQEVRLSNLDFLAFYLLIFLFFFQYRRILMNL